MNLFFCSLDNGYQSAIRQGFQHLKQSVHLLSGMRICIKPNLTFPTYRKGVMTNPEAVEALVQYLKNFTDHITICESDSGGYNRFSMDEVFGCTGLAQFPQRYGVKVVNLSYAPSRPIFVRAGLRRLRVPLPTLLLDDTDLFITMPVPKVHCNTTISLALKNQWGVIQEPALRLKLHPYFKQVIWQVNRAMPKTVVILDGRYGLTRNGPLRGDVLDLGWFLMCDNIFHADYAVSRMMGFDYHRISYLRYIFAKEGIPTVAQRAWSPPAQSTQFFLEREWTDYPGLMTFKSRILAYVGYESPLAALLHRLLYKFREPFY